MLLAAGVPLVLAACSPLEPLPSGDGLLGLAAPASPAPTGPTVSYDGYGVVEPADWRGVNDSQAEN